MSRMSTPRKLLLTLMVIGACSTTIGAGTFASFNAQAANEATFTSGTVVLERTKDAGTDNIGIGSACFSTGDADENGNSDATDDTDDNHAGGCQYLMNVEVKRPGDTAYADITLLNVGNLPGTLSVQASQSCTTTAAAGQPYFGGGDACAGTRLSIQQYETQTARSTDDTTNGACWFGGGALTSTCTFAGGSTLATFATSHPQTGVSPLDMGAMPAGGVRYLRINVELPENSANDLQGVQANFGFTWSLVQQT